MPDESPPALAVTLPLKPSIIVANLREGRRGQNAGGPQSFMMAAIAKVLQPEQIKAVVAYIMTLNPDAAASPEEQKKQILEGSPFESAQR